MQRTFFITLTSVMLLTVFAPAQPAKAHEDVIGSPRYQMMRKMMGSNTLDLMEQMEEQMMGAQNHEKMEGLMNKLLAGNLSASEQREFIDLMGDVSVGPGATSMMTRLMMPQMMQNLGLFDRGYPTGGFGGMMAGGPIFGYGFAWTFWITTVLVWVVLILLIVALLKWLSKNKK